MEGLGGSGRVREGPGGSGRVLEGRTVWEGLGGEGLGGSRRVRVDGGTGYYKQLVRCSTSVQCTEAGLNSCATVPSKLLALQYDLT